MKVKVNLNNRNINKLDTLARTALEQAGQALLTDIIDAQVIPFDTGHLQNDTTQVDNSKSSKGRIDIVSRAPYAETVYFHPEWNFQTINNPNARGLWFDDWIKGSRNKFVLKAFTELYRKLLGGVK
jgi:hypothetical protein